MDLLEIMRKRRSIRRYTGEKIPEEKLETILQAGLLSASGRAIRPWEFIVVQDKDTLQYLSDSRIGAAKMLQGADCAIVVIGDSEKTDVWIEDCSIAMAQMHLMADSLGVGSCWIQGRLREAEGKTTEEYVREKLEFPESFRLEAILSLGIPEAERQFLSGAVAQYESEVVYHNMKEEFAKQGIIFTDTDTAVQEYPDLVKKYFGTVISNAEHKFSALNSAVWSGGTFNGGVWYNGIWLNGDVNGGMFQYGNFDNLIFNKGYFGYQSSQQEILMEKTKREIITYNPKLYEN